nr:MAG TPA: hypothetical protein [Caudoviricetes sp.]
MGKVVLRIVAVTHWASSLSGTGLHGQTLHAFLLHQTGIQTLGDTEADLTGSSIQLIQALDGAAFTVSDPVAGEVTEQDGLRTGADQRHVVGSFIAVSEQRVRLTSLQTRLPEELAVAVLQLADGLESLVIEQEQGVLAVRRLQRIDQIDQFICGEGSRTGSGDTSGSTIGAVQQTDGLAGAVTVDEGSFLGITDTSGKLSSDVGFHIEHAVLQQFLRHLDDGRNLVCAQRDLTEGVIALRNLTFFIDPAGSAMRSNQRNLAVAGRGVNHLAQRTELVLFLQSLHQSALILIRNEVAALGVGANLQGVEYGIVGIAITHHVPEVVAVLVGCTAGLVGHGLFRTGSKRLAGGRIQFTLKALSAFLAVDGSAKAVDVLFHTLISSGVFGIHHAVFVGVLVQKSLRLVPQFAALLAEFSSLTHIRFPPLMSGFDQVQPLVQLGNGYAGICRLGYGFFGTRFGCGISCIPTIGCRFGCRGRSNSHGSKFSGVFITPFDPAPGAFNPETDLGLSILQYNRAVISRIDDAAAHVHDAVHETFRMGSVRIHPRGFGHHGGNFIPVFVAAAGIDVEDTFLACLEHADGIVQIVLIAESKNAGIVDHPHGARRHFQPVRSHCKYSGGRSSCSGYDDVNITRIGSDIIKHPDRCITRTAVAVQNDADRKTVILALCEQLIMENVRGDLVTVPDLLIDVAVQVDYSQDFTSSFCAHTMPARTKKTHGTATLFPYALYSAASELGAVSHLRMAFRLRTLSGLPLMASHSWKTSVQKWISSSSGSSLSRSLHHPSG